MGELLKERFFVRASIESMGNCIQQHYPDFDCEKFKTLVFDAHWEHKELKARMRHVTRCLHATLAKPYRDSIDILKQAAPHIGDFEGMVFPDYVELYGMDDWEVSLPALGYFTKYASSEFAIRPYLDREPERVMKCMQE